MTTTSADLDASARALYERLRDSSDVVARIEEPRPPTRVDAMVVIVPGAFYRTHRHTGADGQLIRAEASRLGARTAIIPLPNLAPICHNARLIRDWLRHRDDERIFLVSLSKGSADVKAALADPDAFDRVTAWVNISGALDGSPLVDWLFSGALRSYWTRLLLRVRRHDIAAIRELSHKPGTPLNLPAHIRTIHVVGFPQVRHLSSAFARRCYQRIAHLGPNDGAGLLLTDVLSWPGFVYPVWGADHYLSEKRDLIRKVLGFLAETEMGAP